MRRKHYAIGAAILTVGAAAVVLMPKGQNSTAGIAYLPSEMQSPFSAPPAITLPVAEIEAPVIPAQPKAPVQVAEVPTSARIEVPPPVARPHTAQPKTPVASNAPSDTPFVWHGSGGRGQSWKGTGGRIVADNTPPSAPSFSSLSGGGGGGSGKPKAPAAVLRDNNPNANNQLNTETTMVSSSLAGTGSNGGSSPSNPPRTCGLSCAHNGGGNTGGTSSAIVENENGLTNGGHYSSYVMPTGQNIVTVDEPGPLSILLVGGLGLFMARRKRTAA